MPAFSPDCAVCGLSEDSPMSRYSHSASIGLLHLGTLEVYDTGVRIFSDDGREMLSRDGVSFGFCNFGEAYGYAHISSMPNRGIATVDITYGTSDKIDFAYLEENLCPDCMDKILEGCRESGENECRNIFLIDFRTMEFYPLPGDVVSFMRGDYYFHLDHKKGRDAVLIVYVPERVSSITGSDPILRSYYRN